MTSKPPPSSSPTADASDIGTEETIVPHTSGATSSIGEDETIAPPSGAGRQPAFDSGVGPVELPAGTRAGEYLVEGLIGEGGFGRVYRGIHPVIGKPVAIKVLHLRYSADPDIVSRFVAEARAVNQIGHDGIIDIFAFGTLPDGRHYYVMELLEGITLRELIRDRGRLDIDESISILRQVGGALDAAHAAGVAHRDFKPDNIFLTPRDGGWRVTLLDFGVAKLMGDAQVDHRTETGASVGTPAYMAPEQVVGKSVDHRADIYAFGVVAFHMLAGRLPFEADSAFSLMAAHVNEEPPDLAAHVGDLPPGIADAVRWALAKSPADRPPDLAAFTQRLSTFGTQPPGAGLPTPTITTGFERPSRGPMYAAAAAVLALLAVGGWWLSNRGPASEASADAVVGSAVVPTGSATPAPPPPVAAVPDAAVPDAAPDVSPPDAALPAVVALRFEGAPDGAEVFDGEGTALGALPGPIELPRGDTLVNLEIRADGYLDQPLSVTPARDQTVRIDLTPRPKPKVQRRRTRTPTPPTPQDGAGKKPGADSLEPF